MLPTKTFIRVAEVWLPNPEHTLLEYGGHVSGPEGRQFGAISQSLSFGPGGGLPGLAWQGGAPVLLKRLEAPAFERGDAAKAAGLSCGLALPVFVHEALTAVLVLYCSDDEAQAGAIELWRNDPRVTTDMTLVDGHYGHGGDALEALSHDTYLPRGTGLPGLAWQTGQAVFMEDLASAPRFLRTESALSAGIERGLALPWPTRQQAECVVTMLSSSKTPIARRVEGWAPSGEGTLQRTFGFDEVAGHLGEAAIPLPLNLGLGPLGDAFLTGVPQLLSGAAKGQERVVAVPVVRDGQVAEVVALYF